MQGHSPGFGEKNTLGKGNDVDVLPAPSQHGVLLAYGNGRSVGAGPAGGVTVRKVVAGVWLFSGEFLPLQKQPGTGGCRSVTYVWAMPKPTASERL